jgi:hypothetical protein
MFDGYVAEVSGMMGVVSDFSEFQIFKYIDINIIILLRV